MAKFDVASVFGEELKKVSESDTAVQLLHVDIDLIDENELNFYTVTEENVSDLMDSIALNGLLDPLLVVKNGERYRLISGHRRRLAIKQLVADGREDLRTVPVIVRSPKSAAAEELELIYANSTARILSGAELGRQAERVERLLYELKEEGVEFPGRMRDHVAAACNVSRTKIANLKIIREKLPQKFVPAYESGRLSEDAALKICRLPKEILEIVKKSKKDAPLASAVADCARYAESLRHPEIKCPDGSACSNTERKILQNLSVQYSWQRCDPDHCCKNCSHVLSCSYACKTAQSLERAERKEADAKEDAARAKARRKNEKRSMLFAKRIVSAADAAGLPDSWTTHLSGSTRWETTLAALRGVADGTDFSVVSLYGFLNFPSSCDDIVALVEDLQCPADYLLGLTDELSPAPAGKPEWKTGTPPDGLYACKVDCGGAAIVKLLRFDSGKWILPGADVTAMGDVVGWYPLPND